jgi:hypothetical protein
MHNQIPKIISALPKENFQLGIIFNDGKSKTVDINPFIKNGVSAALRDPQYFKKVIVENGYITWENGFDFCPEFLYNL